MHKIESLEEFYKRKFNWIPDDLRREIGHFNIFRLEPYVEGKPTKIPYKSEHLDRIREGIYCIFELLHFALKLEPSAQAAEQSKNASQRISMMFMELLERQFPIDDEHQTVKLRSASDFAFQLNIPVNHLNKALKETTKKNNHKNYC